MLGFEETIFTVKEEDRFVELCVNIFQPPVIDPLTNLPVEISDIDIITRSQDGTASNNSLIKIFQHLWYY